MTLSVTYTISGTATTISFSETATSHAQVAGTFNTAAEFQTAAIQQALNNCAGVGGTVSLSAGTFSLSPGATASAGCLIIKSNTIFVGAGTSTILKLATNNSHDVTGIVRTADGVPQPDGSISSSSNITISNLVIDGNRSSTTTGYDVDGFYCGPDPNSTQYHDSNITLSGVTVQYCSRYGFDPHATTTNLQFLNCAATDNLDGFTIDGCGQPGVGNGVLISGCVATSNDRHGINITTGSNNVSITGGTTATLNGKIVSNGVGIAVQTGNNEARTWTGNITIDGVTVNGNGAVGSEQIRVTQASNITINNVTSASTVLVKLNGVDGALVTVADPTKVLFSNYTQDFPDWGLNGTSDDRTIPYYNIKINNVMNAGGSPTPTWDFDKSPATRPSQEIDGNANTLYGDEVTALTEMISAGGGNDTIYGYGGVDGLYGDDDDDIIYGGDGDDADVATTTKIKEGLYGGTGNDVIDGGAGADWLDGGTGNDSLIGGSENDTLVGGMGNDKLDGGTGKDAMTGGLGDDIFVVDVSTDTITEYVGEGTDTVETALAVYSLTALNVENLKGTNSAGQTLTGNNIDNAILGGSGNDTLDGGSGADTLDGGAGDDTLNGGGGSFDTASYASATSGVTVSLLAAGGQNTGGSGLDTLISIENLSGSAFNDTLTGSNSATVVNVLNGGDGDDILNGKGGNDTLIGGNGFDRADYAGPRSAYTISIIGGLLT